MELFLMVVGGLLVAIGLLGAVLPMLPGLPLIFAGIWLIAAADHYRHLGAGWLIGIACVGTVGVLLDLLAGALGAKRVGASPRAVWGAFIGTLVGLFFGLPGLLLGPFIGAVAGELSMGRTVERSARVGAAAWLGLIFGTVAKLVASAAMVAMFGLAWWLNRAVASG